ncbi:hypothetical protein [Microbacterium sp. SLBN-154]|uniref:hypothetical protein n=1 Tax=Microbacterium sp. SLBN-154 TaxID=2768458 RepID=UPI001153F54C|nr:hypothetical protein [Microbacterium sp. SLBN-154]
MAIDSQHALRRPYRSVRRVDDTAAPWPGEVVRDSGGAAWLLVDARALGEDWAGWRASRSDHLLAPSDLVRTAAGHAALFPICSDRLIDVVRRRSDDGDPLSAGEALTLAVSVLRGHVDAGASTGGTAGTWWLTDEARPVLALQPTDPSESAAIFRLLLGMFPAWAEVLRDGLSAMEKAHPHERDVLGLEERLFALASPQPLRAGARRTASTTPGAVPGVSARPLVTPEASRAAARAATSAESDDRGLLARISALMDRDLGDTVSRATTGVWRAVSTKRPRSRRRGFVIAAGAAAVVLAVGLTWPSDPESPAAAEPVVTTPSSDASHAPASEVDSADTAAAAPTGSTEPTPADLVAVADRLLTARAACGEDRECLAAIIVDPERAPAPGASDLPTGLRTVTFLDDLGGAAVLRVAAHDSSNASATSQLIVIVRIGEDWLIRDIHDAGATS